jgi:ParB-like chromosome segregation protein Spo0J
MDYIKTSKLKPAKWVSASYVVSPDYRRLTNSIIKYGILSPILTQKNGKIIDGYHRWAVANEQSLDRVPVTIMDIDDIDAMLLHIDMNRSRGIVVAKYLSRMIKRILASGKYNAEELCRKLEMTNDEFDVLADGTLIKMRKIKQHSYSPAWVPIESASGEDIRIERPTGHTEQV